MGKPVYHCFRARFTEAWYQLSEGERNALMEKVTAVTQQVGGKPVIACNSRWASEQWAIWGVEEFPDLEALQRHTQLQEELQLFRYVQSETLLGTPFEQPA